MLRVRTDKHYSNKFNMTFETLEFTEKYQLCLRERSVG